MIPKDVHSESFFISFVAVGEFLLKTFRAIQALPDPEILTIPIPPKPIGVEMAAIVSLAVVIKKRLLLETPSAQRHLLYLTGCVYEETGALFPSRMRIADISIIKQIPALGIWKIWGIAPATALSFLEWRLSLEK